MIRARLRSYQNTMSIYVYADGRRVVRLEIYDLVGALRILHILVQNDVVVEGIEEILGMLKDPREAEKLGIDFVGLIEDGLIDTSYVAKEIVETLPEGTIVIVAPSRQKYEWLLRNIDYSEKYDKLLVVAIFNADFDKLHEIEDILRGKEYGVAYRIGGVYGYGVS